MQTFLPYPNFYLSAQALDNKRLGKQRVEAKQILMALEYGPYQYHNGEKWVGCSEQEYFSRPPLIPYRRTPWYNHPATKMWRGHERALARYGICTCLAWLRRGFKDSLYDFFDERYSAYTNSPQWLGNGAFHRSHQSNLVRKDPTFYRPKFPDVPDDLPYVWPTP